MQNNGVPGGIVHLEMVAAAVILRRAGVRHTFRSQFFIHRLKVGDGKRDLNRGGRNGWRASFERKGDIAAVEFRPLVLLAIDLRSQTEGVAVEAGRGGKVIHVQHHEIGAEDSHRGKRLVGELGGDERREQVRCESPTVKGERRPFGVTHRGF